MKKIYKDLTNTVLNVQEHDNAAGSTTDVSVGENTSRAQRTARRFLRISKIYLKLRKFGNSVLGNVLFGPPFSSDSRKKL